jgi:DNA-binding transcriptional regulator YdaS (Cro superfamily)
MTEKQKRAARAALRRAIKAAGSQSALARLTRISQGHISKLVAGLKTISAEDAVAVHKSTGVDPSILRPDLRPLFEQSGRGRGTAPALRSTPAT